MSSLNLFDGADNENGLSRCVAIILNEHAMFRDRLIDIMNKKLSDNNSAIRPIVKPSSREEFKIEIQRRATTLKYIAEQFKDNSVNRIIPVTLTPDEPVSEEAYDTSDQNPIPDVAFLCFNEDNADLILIEAKLNFNRAEGQVKGQAEKIKDLLNEGATEGKAEVLNAVVSLKWKEITVIMQQINDMMPGLESLIIKHYLEHIENRFSRYIPAKKFKRGMTENMIKERMKVLASNVAKKFCDQSVEAKWEEHDEDWKHWRITKNFGYAESFLMYSGRNGITIALLIGYLKRQDTYLLYNNNICEDMSWTFGEEKINGYVMSVEPVLLFKEGIRKFETLWQCPLDKNALGTARNEIRKKFQDFDLVRRWSDSCELKKRLPKIKGLLKNPDELDTSFAKDIAGHNNVNVTLEYWTEIVVPAEDIEDWDNDSNLNKADDKVADRIFAIINGIRERIEKPNEQSVTSEA